MNIINLNHTLNQIFAWPPPNSRAEKHIDAKHTHGKTTVVRSGWSCHSKQTLWRGVLKSHCAVIINESIVDRVSFSATVEIFQMAVFVWLSDAVTLHRLSCCESPSNELMLHPVSYHSGAAPQDTRSTETHATTRVHSNHRNKHSNNMRAEAACSVTSVQLTW